ncbi:MAG: DJ-1/PfpI family protein [Actinomycetota bacterium]
MRTDIVVYDGVDELDVVGPLEVLRSAAGLGAAVEVRLVTRMSQAVVTGAHGLSFQTDGTYSAGADVLIVPGGGWVAKSPQGAWAEAQRGHLVQILRRAGAAQEIGVIAGVCTGTMLRVRAGVVGKRRATTHHDAWEDLAASGATLIKDRVVDDGDLVTSGGVTSGIDLALWLVERELSRDLADRVAQRLEYVRFRPPA